MIKAQRYRTQEKNREEALQRLQQLIQDVAITQKKTHTDKTDTQLAETTSRQQEQTQPTEGAARQGY